MLHSSPWTRGVDRDGDDERPQRCIGMMGQEPGRVAMSIDEEDADTHVDG